MARKVLQIDRKDLKVCYATTPTSTTGNQEVETIADKPKEEETVKAEPSSASSYMTREQDTKIT